MVVNASASYKDDPVNYQAVFASYMDDSANYRDYCEKL
jgi:hypothetical protein